MTSGALALTTPTVAKGKNNPSKKLRVSRGAQGVFSFFTARSGARGPLTVPTRWVKMVAGIFLLPVAGILAQTFFTCLSHETIHHAFWMTHEFCFFAIGALLWTSTFFFLPRPLWIYVFGHELTHAIWVWAMGGRVSKFKVTSDGGHIITDTHNFWIALAPYFFPIYSVLVIALYGGASLFWEMFRYRDALFALIGATWAFHVCFTLWMIPKGQSDLKYHGTFFSLVIIGIMNIALMSVLLILASPHVTWRLFAHKFFENAETFSAWVRDTFQALLAALM